MIEFDLSALIYIAKDMGRLASVLETSPDLEFRNKEQKDNDIRIFTMHKEQFDNLGLDMCSAQASRIVSECQIDQILTQREMAQMVKELANRLEDQCRLTHYLAITKEENDLIAPDEPLFGTNVEDKIPSVIEDISDGGKCLGFRRATASVFHMMRVMEIGVQKFGEQLGVTLTEEKNWQTILDQINPKIKELGKDQKAKLYASIAAHLYNVKLAWRNETMHPKATYTDEEARLIFAVVRGFMNDLVRAL